MTELFVFLVGLVVGSFLNVCIHRLPRGESVVRPGSYCPKCGKSIPWFDNLPVLSFLLLRGRCRDCRERISFRYPAVELASGLLWWESWQGTDGGPIFWVRVIFLSLLLGVSAADLETGLIPDRITFLGIAAGLAASFFYPDLHVVCRGEVPSPLGGGVTPPLQLCAVGKSIAGLAAGGALIYVTGLIGNWIFQRESMGGGDVKLLAMAGSFLGWEKTLLVFFTAPVVALPFAIYQRWVKKEEVIPYGPFLSLAAAVQFFWGDKFWHWFIFGS